MLRIILVLVIAALTAHSQSDTTFTISQREYLERVARKMAEEKQAQSDLSALREQVMTQRLEIQDLKDTKKVAESAAKTAESANTKANVIIGIMLLNVVLALALSAGQ